MGRVTVRIPMSAATMALGHVQTLAVVAAVAAAVAAVAVTPLLPLENPAVPVVLVPAVLAVREAVISAEISLGVQLGIGHGLIEILKHTQLLVTIP